MTLTETKKILAVVRAAYPNFYKSLTATDANAMVVLWARQFSHVPYYVMNWALERIIKKSQYPPSISEMYGVVEELCGEAYMQLRQHEQNVSFIEDEGKDYPDIAAMYKEDLLSDKRVAILKEMSNVFLKRDTYSDYLTNCLDAFEQQQALECADTKLIE